MSNSARYSSIVRTTHGEYRPIEAIDRPLQEAMFVLLQKYFGNVRIDDFIADLRDKQYVILLWGSNGKLVGFSTQKCFTSHFEGSKVGVIYSGDTIIERAYWGSLALPRAFWQLRQHVASQLEVSRIFWVLISKGIRTYKFLPVYLQEYYPHHARATPEPYRDFIQRMGRLLFPTRYDPATGIVRSLGQHQYLKENYHPTPRENCAPYEAFFYAKNPHYRRGDELLSIAELSLDNFKPALRKYFQAR